MEFAYPTKRCATTAVRVAPAYNPKRIACINLDIDRFIAAMPKCELYVHVEGTLEAELNFRLAARNGITLPLAKVASWL